MLIHRRLEWGMSFPILDIWWTRWGTYLRKSREESRLLWLASVPQKQISLQKHTTYPLKSLIKPVLTYGSATWRTTKNDEQDLLLIPQRKILWHIVHWRGVEKTGKSRTIRSYQRTGHVEDNKARRGAPLV